VLPFVEGGHFFFLPLAWDRSEAATDFAALVDLGSRRIFDAWEATLGLVCLAFLAMDEFLFVKDARDATSPKRILTLYRAGLLY
jgi:hypothetical protein